MPPSFSGDVIEYLKTCDPAQGHEHMPVKVGVTELRIGETSEKRKDEKESQEAEGRYLYANQRSETFVPGPCHHVPYLSQILLCSMTGRVDPCFHLTG